MTCIDATCRCTVHLNLTNMAEIQAEYIPPQSIANVVSPLPKVDVSQSLFFTHVFSTGRALPVTLSESQTRRDIDPSVVQLMESWGLKSLVAVRTYTPTESGNGHQLMGIIMLHDTQDEHIWSPEVGKTLDLCVFLRSISLRNFPLLKRWPLRQQQVWLKHCCWR